MLLKRIENIKCAYPPDVDLLFWNTLYTITIAGDNIENPPYKSFILFYPW